MKGTRYVYLLASNDRKRHEHTTEQGKVIRFVVQHETFREKDNDRKGTFHQEPEALN